MLPPVRVSLFAMIVKLLEEKANATILTPLLSHVLIPCGHTYCEPCTVGMKDAKKAVMLAETTVAQSVVWRDVTQAAEKADY